MKLRGLRGCGVALGCVVWAVSVWAQEMPKPEQAVSTPDVVRKDADTSAEAAENQKALEAMCRQYQHSYIAYYSDVFFVKDCQRIPVSTTELEGLLKKKARVVDVEGQVIRSIPLAEVREQAPQEIRSCELFDKRYVTAHFVYIYYVENCVKRPFPDWESWADDQKQRAGSSPVIMQVSDWELVQMKDGEPFPSVFDEIQRLGDGSEPDLLPIDEACEGLNGRWVSYYQQIYRVEKCHKRQASARYLLTHRLQEQPAELTDQQWMSLPDGEELLSSQESLERGEP